MAKVHMSSEFKVSPEQIWNLLGQFNALPDWHPAVQKSELEDGGKIRRLSLVGGGEIVERLEQSSDDERVYRYSIVTSPLPVAEYVAEIRVKGEGETATVEWSSEFVPSGATEGDAIKVIQNIYQTGFDNLKKMLGG